MGEVADVLLGLACRARRSRTAIDLMRPAGKVDAAQDQLDRDHSPLRLPQVRFDRRFGLRMNSCARAVRREAILRVGADHAAGVAAGEPAKDCVDGDDGRRRRRPAGLRPRHWRDRACGRLRARSGGGRGYRAAMPASASTMMAKLISATREREPAAGIADGGDSDGRVGNDRDRAHRGEVMAADRQRQQQRAGDAASAPWSPSQPDRKRDRAEHGAEHDRDDDQRRVPDDACLRVRRRPCRCNASRRCRRRRWRRRSTAGAEVRDQRTRQGRRRSAAIAAISETTVSTML